MEYMSSGGVLNVTTAMALGTTLLVYVLVGAKQELLPVLLGQLKSFMQ